MALAFAHFNLTKNGMFFELLKSAISHNSTIFHHDYSICMLYKIERMSDHQNGLSLAVLAQCLKENERSDVGVNCTKHIVKNENIGICVNGPRKGHSRFLPA